ncbi:hypothetical protein J6590_090069 [Homalodisca vitripennis]|nr:hypothetical protein J6590_090069 [Homalodisca vitripennis]
MVKPAVMLTPNNYNYLLSPHLVSHTSLTHTTVMLTPNNYNYPALTSSRLTHISYTYNRDTTVMLTPNNYNYPALTSSRLNTSLTQTTVMLTPNNYNYLLSPHLVSDISYTDNHNRDVNTTTTTTLLSPHLVSDTSLTQTTVMLTPNNYNYPALTSSRLRHISYTDNRDVNT